jgi:hypothetical protein
MYTFYIISIIGILCTIIHCYKSKKFRGEGLFFTFVVGPVMLAAFSLGLTEIDDSYKVDSLYVKVSKLKSLEDDKTSFVLGMSDFSSDPLYYYYYQQPNGGYKLGSKKYHSVVLFEANGAILVERFHKKFYKKSKWIWANPAIENIELDTYIYLPTNTIKRTYNIDSK